MTAITVALASALVAMTMGSLLLRKYGPLLKAKSQSFRFHELRDRLQLLTVEGKISPESSAYNFLQFSINLAIRNAGVMKLRQLLKVTRDIDKQSKVVSSRDVFSDIAREDEEVQKLAADVFAALCDMLVSNDRVTFIASQFANRLRWALWSDKSKSVIRSIFPERSRAVREVFKYKRISERLANAA